jgi:glycine cleavage system H lipoate-binding protein
MIGFRYVDIFATKQIEYLLVILFLLLLVAFWRFLNKPARSIPEAEEAAAPEATPWFNLPEGFFYHQGHSWAAPEGNLIKVGIDDFAQKLIGNIQSIEMACPGSDLEQGAVGWRFDIGSKTVDMLSPVEGKVVEVNKSALENPEIINQDPYGAGWLMAIIPHDRTATLKNLLAGGLARAWMDLSIGALMGTSDSELGLLYQDGGTPVTGIAKAVYRDDWDLHVKKFFLTESL